MTLGDRLRVLDRAQHSRPFKIAATVAVLLLAAVGFAVYASYVLGERGDPAAALAERLGEEAEGEPYLRLLAEVTSGASDLTAAGVAAVVGAAVATVVVWLGLGLTYLGLAIVAAGVAVPMLFFNGTHTLGRILIGVVALTASFTALMHGLRAILSAASPPFAVARNVLSEAVRLKISLIFIVLLILGLALLPSLLNDEQPLRYRVQTFLQYAVGGSFWLIAILTIVFAVTTVTTEQRDKIIWQTATKPVAPWQYLLGKWLGIVSLNAVLLLVVGSGIFLFTEYLRGQPAVGEREAYQVSPEGVLSEDRLYLETRVLTARVVERHDTPPELSPQSPRFAAAVREFIENERLTNPGFAETVEERSEVVKELLEQELIRFRTIDPGGAREYTFSRLDAAADSSQPLNLRYNFNSGGNRPDIFYDITMVIGERGLIIERSVNPGQFHQVSLSPDLVSDDGSLRVVIVNGRFAADADGNRVIVPNPTRINFQANGLEIYYAAGGFHLNYVRVVTMLWFKLAFLAMIAVAFSTFLSFPVAAVCSLSVFVIAEMSSFIGDADEYYGTTDVRGNLQIHRVVGVYVSESVGWLFEFYAGLAPISRLVDGRLLGWFDFAGGVAAHLLVTAVFAVVAWLVFRRRELAIYSGN